MLLVCAAVLARVVHASRCRAADELARAEVAVLEAAVTDELTGLANRRGLLEAGRRLLGTRDPADPLSVLFLDVDGLKRTNDLLGHAMGDRLVAAAGAALRRGHAPGRRRRPARRRRVRRPAPRGPTPSAPPRRSPASRPRSPGPG